MIGLTRKQNDEYFELDSFGQIADLAYFILSNCVEYPPDWDQPFVSGQAFKDAGWNVIVREDWTDGC